MSTIESHVNRAEVYRSEVELHATTYLGWDPGAVLLGEATTSDWQLAYKAFRAITERTLGECSSPDDRKAIRQVVRDLFDRPGQSHKAVKFWEDMDEDKRERFEVRTPSGLIIPGQV